MLKLGFPWKFLLRNPVGEIPSSLWIHLPSTRVFAHDWIIENYAWKFTPENPFANDVNHMLRDVLHMRKREARDIRRFHFGGKTILLFDNSLCSL